MKPNSLLGIVMITAMVAEGAHHSHLKRSPMHQPEINVAERHGDDHRSHEEREGTVDPSAKNENNLAERDSNPLGGFKSGMDNAHQRIDSTVNDMRKLGNRPAAAVLTNLITGLDGQIDNVLSMIGSGLSPVTLGLSNVVFGAILGPTFQSITDGAEVLIGNLAGAPIDMVLVPAMHLFANNIKNVANIAGKYEMVQEHQALSRASQKLDSEISRAGKQQSTGGGGGGHKHARGSPEEHVSQSNEVLQQVLGQITTTTESFESKQSKVPSDVHAFIEVLHLQVSKAASIIPGVVDHATQLEHSENSRQTASTLIGPVLQAAIHGADVLISAATLSGVDKDSIDAINNLSNDYEVLSNTAQQYQHPASQTLRQLSGKIQHLAAHVPSLKARTLSIPNAVMGGIDNAMQRFNAFTTDLKSNNARPGSQAMVHLITGLDGQIDNVLGAIQQGLAPLTGGLSDLVLAPILGPTFQSLTDGVEVLIGNLGGGILDIGLVPAMHLLSGSLKNAGALAKQYSLSQESAQLIAQSGKVSQMAHNSEAHHKKTGGKH